MRFISPSYTTGVTDLLDQLNKNIHQEYEEEKSAMLTEFNSLNRESFMLILTNIWPKWVTKDKLINAAKQLGIRNETVSVEFMQHEKFKKAEEYMGQEAAPSLSIPMATSNPVFMFSPNK